MKDISEKSYHRILLLLGICFCLSMALMIQLFVIQGVNHRKYTIQACKQRQYVFVQNELRGSFYDRHGRKLRGPKKGYFLIVNNHNLNKADWNILQRGFPDQLVKEYSKNRSSSVWVYSKPLNTNQLRYLETHPINGIQLLQGIIGRESSNILAWHLLGSFETPSHLSGLEYSYQSILQNKRNSATVFKVIDGHQGLIPGLGIRARNQYNQSKIYLTIDSRIQKIVESEMDQAKMTGAIVIMDVKTGHILALASRPVINPLRLMESMNSSEAPFMNRAISAYYPGSIFKLVTLSAGLDSGCLKWDEPLEDPGYFQIEGDKKWYCTTSGGIGHGAISLQDALAFSCNPVFIEITLNLGPEMILDYAEKFGFGLPCNIGLAEENWGNIPTGIQLSQGEQANLALGQQLVTATPLQIVSMIQTIANDGIRKPPVLVEKFTDPHGRTKINEPGKAVRVIKTETALQLKKMMTAVVDYGTGNESQTSMGTAGKTGTAQGVIGEKLADHAWFAGFVPRSQPRLAAVVFCEKGISGGKTAAPVFKNIMEKVKKFID